MTSRNIACQLDSTESSHPGTLQPSVGIAAENLVTSLERVRPSAVTGEIRQQWLALMESMPFQSPYYHPEFMDAVALVRDDVEVALLKNIHGKTVGILPFQRAGSNLAPIGGRMNDFHGIIGSEKLRFDLRKLLSDLEFDRFGFHALQTGSDEFSRFCFEPLNSYYVDLSAGSENYFEWLVKHSQTIKRLPQKVRALSRRVGPVSFEFESDNSVCLERLIELKRRKFQHTNTFDILSVDWTANLLREIFGVRKQDFRGALSVLWAGDELVAAQMGMIYDDVLHYWFPSFDPAFARYSPGLQLMVNSCQAAAAAGIQRIDMSYGDSTFKDKFCNGKSQVDFGVVDFNRLRFELSKQRYFFRKNLKQMPGWKEVKFAVRKLFPNYGKWHFS